MSRRDVVLIVCASVSWGTVGIANQLLYSLAPTNALSLAFWRLAFALPWFFLAAWIALRGRLFQMKWRDLGMMALMGCLQALSQTWYVAAIADIGISVSTLIAICASPVIVATFSSLVMRERLALMTLVALAAALGGTALLVTTGAATDGGRDAFAGAVFACLSAGSYAGFILCGRWLSGHCHPLQISAIGFGAGTILLLVIGVSSTGLVVSYPVEGWLLLLYLGVVPTALGYGLFQVGMRSLSATVASILTMCEPLTAATLAWFFFGEALGPLGLLGAGCLLGAMAIILLVPNASLA